MLLAFFVCRWQGKTHVWKLAVLCIALPGWSYTDCYRKKKKNTEEGRKLRAGEKKGGVGAGESQARKKGEK